MTKKRIPLTLSSSSFSQLAEKQLLEYQPWKHFQYQYANNIFFLSSKRKKKNQKTKKKCRRRAGSASEHSSLAGRSRPTDGGVPTRRGAGCQRARARGAARALARVPAERGGGKCSGSQLLGTAGPGEGEPPWNHPATRSGDARFSTRTRRGRGLEHLREKPPRKGPTRAATCDGERPSSPRQSPVVTHASGRSTPKETYA